MEADFWRGFSLAALVAILLQCPWPVVLVVVGAVVLVWLLSRQGTASDEGAAATTAPVVPAGHTAPAVQIVAPIIKHGGGRDVVEGFR